MASSSHASASAAQFRLLTEAERRALTRLTEVGPFRFRPRDRVRLHILILDTAERVLARHGVELRLERQGRQWYAAATWTLSDPGVAPRPPIRMPLDSAPPVPFQLPDGPLLIYLDALVAQRPLVPTLAADTSRRQIDIVSIDAAQQETVLAILVLDHVRWHRSGTDGPSETTTAIDIRSVSGDPGDLEAVVTALQERLRLVPWQRTSLAAVTLAGSSGATKPVPIDTADTIAQGARKIVGRYLRQLRMHDPGTRLGDDPEALHDMRVASRRLRAAVRAFSPGIPPRLRTQLGQELQWLARQLGAVRDLDVQLGNVTRYSAAAPPGHRDGLGSLRTHMECERKTHRTAMLAVLGSRRYYRLLMRMEHFADSTPAPHGGTRASREPLLAVGARALADAFRRLVKRGRKIQATPAPEDLHALRIRAKRLRYLLEFLQTVTGKPGRRLVKRLVGLQDLLGTYHDRVVAAEFVRAYVEGAGAQQPPSVLLTFGAFVAQELHRAEAQQAGFQRAWKRFARRRTRREVRAVLGHLGVKDA